MRKLSAAAVLAIASLSGCATNVSPNSYSVGAVGQVNRTISATVISARSVDISGTTGTGAGVGIGAGAVAGSAIGGSGRANLLGAIGGAVVGGLAGAAIEQNATKQMGIEYVVQTENGNLMTLVQGPESNFQPGAQVLVLYGSPARVIADPRR